MVTNRRPLRRGRKLKISPEAIAAWQACDQRALACALGLNSFCDPSPLPSEITASGVSPDMPPHPNSDLARDESYGKVLTIQRELLAVAGWPDCRQAYERNLREAEESHDYYAMLIRDPDARYQGTGMDTASLRQRLKEAREEVTYRKKLLADLDAKETAHER
jgi:hypothetical protein